MNNGVILIPPYSLVFVDDSFYQPLKRTIYMCENYECYKAGLFTRTASAVGNWYHYILERLINNPYDIQIFHGTAEWTLRFTNGSSLSIMIATENSRGKRFHHALVENSVNAIVAREIISKMVTLRWCKDDMS